MKVSPEIIAPGRLFDDDLERSVLGRILLPRDDVPLDLEDLHFVYFHSPQNQLVFKALRQLRRSGQPLDPLVLTTCLKDTGNLRKAGGAAYIARLIDVAATNPGWCVMKLRQFAFRRASVDIAERTIEFVQSDRNLEGEQRLSVLLRRLSDVTTQLDDDSPALSHGLRSLDLLKTLTEEPPAQPWVIERWLAPQDVVCLAGDAKVGKSWLALALSLALARGGRFLDKLTIKGGPYRVVYIDEENNPTLVADRIRKLAKGEGLTGEIFPTPNLHYLHGNALSLDDERQLRLLMKEITRFKPHWMVFDSLVRFHSRDENSNSAMSQFYGQVIRPLRSQGCGAVLIHHLSKPDKGRPAALQYRVRGASDTIAFVDQIWAVEHREGGSTLRHVISRSAETASPIGFKIQSVERGEGIRLSALEVSETPEELILSLIRESDATGTRRPEILNALEMRGLKSADKLASKYLRRLSDQGLVEKRKEGQVMRYWLAGMAPAEDGPGTGER